MSNKGYAAVFALGVLSGVFFQIQFSKQNDVINAGLTTIAANQVKAEANQALANATLSMIQATAEKSLAMQAAANAARESRP